MEALNPLQKRFLRQAGKTPLADAFVLAGGAALSGAYLKHRRTGDLDFFTRDAGAVRSAVPILEELATSLGLKADVRRLQATFFQVFLSGDAGELKVDVAHDTPFRLAEPVGNEELGFAIESLDDLAANKISALFDRAEPRDFVDVLFLAREYLPFHVLLDKAKQKHMGLDDYWLAQAIARVEQPLVLPHMIRPVTVDELRDFFRARLFELVPPQKS